jgi:hypothetical protein
MLSYFNYVKKILLRALDVVNISSKTCQQYLMLINIYSTLSLLNSFTANTKWFPCLICDIPMTFFLSVICNVKVTHLWTILYDTLYITVQLMHLFYNKTLIQMSHTKTLKITPFFFLFLGPCIFSNDVISFHSNHTTTKTHLHNNILADRRNGLVTLKDFGLPDDGVD